MNYVKAQLNEPNANDEDLVAEDEHPEGAVVKSFDSIMTTGIVSLGKTKKEKEKALRNGELHDLLLARQEIFVAKINKKKASKKFKVKAWREWHGDFIRGNDAEQIMMLTQSM